MINVYTIYFSSGHLGLTYMQCLKSMQCKLDILLYRPTIEEMRGVIGVLYSILMGANPGGVTGAIAPQEFVRVGNILPKLPQENN